MLRLGDHEIDLCLFDAYGTLFDVTAAAAEKNNRSLAISGRRSPHSGGPSRLNTHG